MELKKYITLYRRWWWLLAIGMVLGLATGITASNIQVPVYEASAKVLITRTRQQGTTDILSISDQQLVITYVQLLKTQPVLKEVGSRLGENIDPDSVSVKVIPGTQILQIKVQNEHATQAATTANTLVEVLIEQNEVLQAGRYTSYEEGLNSQVNRVQEQINSLQSQITNINQTKIQQQLDLANQQIVDLQNQITTVQKDIAGYPTLLSALDRASLAEKQAQLDQLRSQLSIYQGIKTNLVFIGKPTQGGGLNDQRVTSLQDTLTLYQQLYLNLLNNLEAVKLARAQSTPTVTNLEEATAPKNPIRPIPLLYTALAGMIGLWIAAGIIFLLDYFDDTLKSKQKIQQVLGIPVIGEIFRLGRRNTSVYLGNQVGSPISNAFGSLRINVSRLMEHKPLKSILITSSRSGEGKTTIALNLAAAFVRSGKKVILLDADFYHPQMHTRLGLENQKGLSDILADGIDWRQVTRDFGGIDIITSGGYSSSAITLLESGKMTQLLKQLQKEQDIIIIDGPPLFVEDSQILASRVTGVLLVVRQGSTLTVAARSMIDQLKLIDANVLGAVINGVSGADDYTFDGYYRVIAEDKLDKDLEETKLAKI